MHIHTEPVKILHVLVIELFISDCLRHELKLHSLVSTPMLIFLRQSRRIWTRLKEKVLYGIYVANAFALIERNELMLQAANDTASKRVEGANECFAGFCADRLAYDVDGDDVEFLQETQQQCANQQVRAQVRD